MNFKNYKLKAWGGYTLQAGIDEDEKDLDTVVVYTDHGDEYMHIKTKSSEYYRYGMFVNLKQYAWKSTDFIRECDFFGKHYDERAKTTVSNELYDIFRHYITGWVDLFGGRNEPYEFNEYTLQSFVERLEQILLPNGEPLSIVMSENHYVSELNEYLSKNNSKISCLYYTNLEDRIKYCRSLLAGTNHSGVHGIAAKRSDDNIVDNVDSVEYVWHDGKEIPTDDVVVISYGSSDEWGYESGYIDIDQFSDNAYQDTMNNIHEYLTDITDMVSKIKNLKEAMNIEDALETCHDQCQYYIDCYNEEDEEDVE